MSSDRPLSIYSKWDGYILGFMGGMAAQGGIIYALLFITGGI